MLPQMAVSRIASAASRGPCGAIHRGLNDAGRDTHQYCGLCNFDERRQQAFALDPPEPAARHPQQRGAFMIAAMDVSSASR